MTPVELLEPEAAGSMTEQEMDDVRRNRDDHLYSDEIDFANPVIIRGTNKVFRQSPSLKVVPHAQRHDALQQLIAECNATDHGLRLDRIETISKLGIVHVTPNFITLRHLERQDAQLYVLEAPVRDDVLAFKRFSTMLSIPYNFSKKNPGFLNKVNFDYYRKLLSADTRKPVAVDIVYENEALELNLEEDGVSVTIQAKRIINFLKTTGKGVELDDNGVPVTPDIGTRLPMFSSILQNSLGEINKVLPDAQPVLQAYAKGYDDNRGRHYARIVFDNPMFNIDLDGDKFQLGLALETDFLGESKEFGQVNVSFLLFRQICANGLMAQWSDEDKRNMREVFIEEELQKQGYIEGEQFYIDNPEYAAAKSSAATRFHMIFDNSGLNIPIVQANVGLETSVFALGLKFFAESRHFIAKRLEALREEFGDVTEEEFIKATHELAKSLKISSPELIKYFLLEFVAGSVTNSQVFRTPFDVVNYMTFMARAYESTVMADIERKAVLFATNLQAILKGQAEKKTVSVAAQYRGALSARLLGLEPGTSLLENM